MHASIQTRVLFIKSKNYEGSLQTRLKYSLHYERRSKKSASDLDQASILRLKQSKSFQLLDPSHTQLQTLPSRLIHPFNMKRYAALHTHIVVHIISPPVSSVMMQESVVLLKKNKKKNKIYSGSNITMYTDTILSTCFKICNPLSLESNIKSILYQ